ncbi:MAG: hypothetical protein ABI639_14505 [Thermoanaerobaculia bacterium]
MNSSTQQDGSKPSKPRTELPDCPGDAKLQEFADLDDVIVRGRPNDDQMSRYDELAREFSGNPMNGQGVAGMLARQLLDHRRSFTHYRNVMQKEVEAKADKLINELTATMRAKRESLEKDPTLAILPNGNSVSLAGIRCAFMFDAKNAQYESSVRPGEFMIVYKVGPPCMFYDPADIAAVRAALHNIGVAINAPTIKGEDRDGDGKVGE